MAGKHFTEKEIQRACIRRNQGHTWTVIAEDLGRNSGTGIRKACDAHWNEDNQIYDVPVTAAQKKRAEKELKERKEAYQANEKRRAEEKSREERQKEKEAPEEAGKVNVYLYGKKLKSFNVTPKRLIEVITLCEK